MAGNIALVYVLLYVCAVVNLVYIHPKAWFRRETRKLVVSSCSFILLACRRWDKLVVLSPICDKQKYFCLSQIGDKKRSLSSVLLFLQERKNWNNRITIESTTSKWKSFHSLVVEIFVPILGKSSSHELVPSQGQDKVLSPVWTRL